MNDFKNLDVFLIKNIGMWMIFSKYWVENYWCNFDDIIYGFYRIFLLKVYKWDGFFRNFYVLFV